MKGQMCCSLLIEGNLKKIALFSYTFLCYLRLQLVQVVSLTYFFCCSWKNWKHSFLPWCQSQACKLISHTSVNMICFEGNDLWKGRWLGFQIKCSYQILRHLLSNAVILNLTVWIDVWMKAAASEEAKMKEWQQYFCLGGWTYYKGKSWVINHSATMAER